METDLQARLDALDAQSLRRRLRELGSGQGPEVAFGAQNFRNFSSNDYLGLAGEPFLREVAKEAIDRYGVGAGASRLVCGNLPPHQRLEDALARWKGCEAALCFSSGYAAAVGAVTALVGVGDVVLLDKWCHASLIDGARLSGAVLRVFPHNHLGRLEKLLDWARQTHSHGRVLIVTEAVFSMDGDRCALAEIVKLKDRYGAWLLLDEAHSAGLLGRHGRGLADAEAVASRVEVQMGTLSKALGGSGGYLCGSRALMDWVLNKARSFVYSTAPAPCVAAVGAAAVEWMESDEAEKRRKTLWSRVEQLARRLPQSFQSPQSAILPLILGEAKRALATSDALLCAGFLVPAIRYPTVPKGAARLRITLSAAHSAEAVDQLANALNSLAVEAPDREVGIIGKVGEDS